MRYRQKMIYTGLIIASYTIADILNIFGVYKIIRK